MDGGKKKWENASCRKTGAEGGNGGGLTKLKQGGGCGQEGGAVAGTPAAPVSGSRKPEGVLQVTQVCSLILTFLVLPVKYALCVLDGVLCTYWPVRRTCCRDGHAHQVVCGLSARINVVRRMKDAARLHDDGVVAAHLPTCTPNVVAQLSACASLPPLVLLRERAPGS